MVKLDQTSTPQFKKCSICGETKTIYNFHKWSTRCYICVIELRRQKRRQLGIKERIFGYINLDGKKVCPSCSIAKPLNEYYIDKSRKDKITTWCKVCIKRVQCSDKGREIHRRACRRYSKTTKGILGGYRGRASPNYRKYKHNYHQIHMKEHVEYCKEQYFYLQDKYGCHSGDPKNWYPAARFIEALETAPVIEIKV